MKKDPTIPVYLITGFLDGGKTNFLKFTMQEPYFNDGSKSLLIVCEEGEEEYTPELLKKTRTKMAVIDKEEDLTPEKLEELQHAFKPERVLIEYNGMWSVPRLLKTALPKNWMFYQIITVLDGENFRLYLNNIKNSAMELLTNTDMVIFNRCKSEEDLVQYQRAVRSVNTRCELVYEGTDGKEMECPEPDLPYDLDSPVIDISDQNYATFYIDMSEHPDRYKGKKLHFLLQIMQNRTFPKDVFVGGRRAMTCCENDIRFLPYIFMYEKAKSLPAKSWGDVTATMKWEYSEGYQEEGPVFYVDEIKEAKAPEEELVYF